MGRDGETVDHDTFTAAVRRLLASDQETADRAIRATLSTLGERVGADDGRALVARVPASIAPLLYAVGPAISFDAEEFVDRVARLEDVDRNTAELHATAVLAVLTQAIDDQEYDRLLGRLPADYHRLLRPGRR
jgi:uncharacterized protein (DUF2267 family)